MHPELLNNTLFLKYYKQWQDNPASIVFAPISEYFLTYGMIDEAFKVCREGLKIHPDLVSGKIVMAKIHLKRGNWEEAEEELHSVLMSVPHNKIAKRVLQEIAAARASEDSGLAGYAGKEEDLRLSEIEPSWNTVTMAGIYASQGHVEHARQIYMAILKNDPGNEAAKHGLEKLSDSHQ